MTRRLSVLLVVLAMLTYVGCRQAAEETTGVSDQQQSEPSVPLDQTTPVVYKVSGMT